MPCKRREWLAFFGLAAALAAHAGEPPAAGRPPVVQARPDGSVLLAARDATVHGEQLRYEPQPHKNTLGYWTRQEDWCDWRFAVARPGRYELSLLQGCGRGQGGSEVRVSVAGQQFDFTAQETGHFQNFKRRTLGVVTFDKRGPYTLEIRPTTKAAAAIMDLREVKLIPLNPEPRTPNPEP